MPSSAWPCSPSSWSSWRGPSARAVVAVARCSALACLLRATALTATAAGAQTAAIPTRPFLPPPPLPASPLGRSLSGAYGAIVRAGTANPGAAAQASFSYVQALQRARMGDVSGALAAAHSAQATAQSAVAPQAVAVPTPVPPAAAPVRPGVPIVENGVPLSPELVVAEQEIQLASELTRRPLDGAKAHYRAALDAYVSGNAGRARSEARAAFDAAADALTTVK